MKATKHNSGFTLVELAIVLVIIGLIVAMSTFKTVEITIKSGNNHNNEGKIILTRKNLTDDFSMTMNDNFDN